MSTETSDTQVRLLRLSEGQTEMLMKALLAASKITPPSGLTETQYIRLRLDAAAAPVAAVETKEKLVL
jgi:hypothetical protein